MTKEELKSKWWYRFLKVIWTISLLISYLSVIGESWEDTFYCKRFTPLFNNCMEYDRSWEPLILIPIGLILTSIIFLLGRAIFFYIITGKFIQESDFKTVKKLIGKK